MTRIMRWRRLAPLALWPLLCSPALGQELYLLAGGQYTPSLKESTYSYSMVYQHNVSEHFFASFTWLNEGHVTDHHRDGLSPQLWVRWLSPQRRLVLAIGAGPWRYYDTTYATSTGRVTDAHDWGVLYSAAAQWYFHAPWVIQLRYNYTQTSTSIETHTLLLGIGYQFEHSQREGPSVPPLHYEFESGGRNEINGQTGYSTQNNFQSPHGVAWAAEYRRRFTAYIDGTLTYLDEGDTHVVKRHGVAGQLGLKREFLNHHADVGVAAGLYYARDEDEAGQRTKGLGILTMTATWHLSKVVKLRAYWYRTLTTNGRDTDVAMWGLGFAF